MGFNKDESDQQNSNSNVVGNKKENQKDHTPSKVVIRRLPPTLTPEDFLQQVSPLPDYDFFYFVRADMSLGQNAFTRAYINFLIPDDIFIFRDRFDGYVFLDAKGGEYPAIVEFAPFQKVPKKKNKKLDTKIGLIDLDSDYKKFVETLTKPAEVSPVSLDAMVAEVETKENSIAKSGSSKVTTPLLEYLRKRREERKLNIAKLKEERRRGGGGRDRDIDRKRSGKDELDKRKSTSSKDGLRDRDRRRDRVRIRERDRRRERDGPRSEKSKELKSGEKRWQKETEVAPRHTVMLLKNTERESHSSEKSLPAKVPVGEWEKIEEGKEVTPESLLESEHVRGGNEQKRDDRRGKREGKWGDTVGGDEERNQYGGKERGRGNEDDRNKDRLSREKGGRGYREEESMKRNRYTEERGGGDKYYGKDRGGAVRGRGDRNGGGMRDRYDGGGNERKGGGGDAMRKKEADVDRKRCDRGKGQEKPVDTGRSRGNEDEKKEWEEGLTSTNEASRDEKDRQKEDEKSGRCESLEARSSVYKVETNSNSVTDNSEPALLTSRQEREENEERGGSTDGEDKKRKRKDRPERQIYIPRKALERHKQSSPQMGKGSEDKVPEPS